MSCGHGWHGCGPWCDPPPDRGWFASPDWYQEEPDRRIRGRRRRYRRFDSETATEDLEARLEELHEEVRRVEAELVNLRGAGKAAAVET